MKLMSFLLYGLMILNGYNMQNVVPKEVPVPILIFHDFTVDEAKFNPSRMTEEKLEEVLDKLQEEGYETITFKELKGYVNCQNDLPKKPVIITMDDGYKSNYDIAYPLLKERNMTALVSVIGSSMNLREPTEEYPELVPHLSWEELKEMTESGVFEVGNHTYNLHNLKINGYDRDGILINSGENEKDYSAMIKKDVSLLNSIIDENCKTKCRVFCYPFGYRSELSDKIIEEMGFDVTLSTTEGVNKINRGDKLYGLKRINVTLKTDTNWIIRKIKKGS